MTCTGSFIHLYFYVCVFTFLFQVMLQLTDPLAVFASPLLAVALEWLVTDVERYASMDSAEAWKRELDNLQMGYMASVVPEQAEENDSEGSTETFVSLAVDLISITLVQDGYLLSSMAPESIRRKPTPPKVSSCQHCQHAL